mgnify:CR=1 FL=1
MFPAIIPIQNFADGKYLLMSTKRGIIKKTPLTEYDTSRKTGLQGIALKEDDELISVRLTDGEDNVVLVTQNGQCITFNEKLLNLLLFLLLFLLFQNLLLFLHRLSLLM